MKKNTPKMAIKVSIVTRFVRAFGCLCQFDSLSWKCLKLEGRRAERQQLCGVGCMVGRGSQERGSRESDDGGHFWPITSYDGWF